MTNESAHERDARRRERERDRARERRESNKEHIREHNRAYRQTEQYKVWRREYRAANREKLNAQEAARQRRTREQERRKREAEQRKAAAAERRRQYQRRRYHENIEANRAYNREASLRYIARQLAQNPEEFRARKRENYKRSYVAHRDEHTAKGRERYRADRAARLEQGRRYYLEHAEQIKARRRERYAQNPDYQRERRKREKRRRDAGLPPRRLHHVPLADRTANQKAADDFFTRPRTPQDLDAVRVEQPTRRTLLEARARRLDRFGFVAQAGDQLMPELLQRRALSEARRLAESIRQRERELAELAEEARMDAIGASVNARLRTQPLRHPPHLDPATSHLNLSPPITGGPSL